MSVRRQSGFTLIEVLVTLVVLSVGLLGLLGLQAVSLSNTQVSSARSVATALARNLAERMRANRAGVAADGYSNINHPTAGPAPADCNAAACTPTDMAAYDGFQWDKTLGRSLPQGRGRVTCNDSDPGDNTPCSAQSVFVITVIWAEKDRIGDRHGATDKCPALHAAGDNVTARCFQTRFVP